MKKIEKVFLVIAFVFCSFLVLAIGTEAEAAGEHALLFGDGKGGLTLLKFDTPEERNLHCAPRVKTYPTAALYKRRDRKGIRAEVYYRLHITGRLNDHVSSIYAQSGYVTLWDYKNYTGRSLKIDFSSVNRPYINVGDFGYNDMAASAEYTDR